MQEMNKAIEIISIGEEEPRETDIEIISDEPKNRNCPKWGCFSKETEIRGKIFVIGHGYQKIHRCKQCGLEWTVMERNDDE